MSTTELRLELAAGTLSAAQARKAIASLPRHLGDREASDLYSGFRAWTWKALDQKRRDDELREWIDVIRRLRLRIGSKNGRDRQLDTLADLIAESVAIAARLPVAEVLRKRHAREVLLLLHRSSEATPKKHVMDGLGINAANMSRIMNLLSSAGLIEIERSGRETHYSLSRVGASEVEKLAQRTIAISTKTKAVNVTSLMKRNALVAERYKAAHAQVLAAMEEVLRGARDASAAMTKRQLHVGNDTGVFHPIVYATCKSSPVPSIEVKDLKMVEANLDRLQDRREIVQISTTPVPAMSDKIQMMLEPAHG